MFARKIAVGGLGAGLVLGLWGTVLRDEPNPERVTVPVVTSVDSLDPIQGMRPIEEVVAMFQQRADDQPLDYLSRTHLGVALLTEARETADLAGYEGAEAALREALEINPIYPPTRLALASALLSQHEFADARAIAQRLVAADPTSLSALALVGDASFELGDYDSADQVYSELVGIERTAPVVSRLARLASVRGANAKAVDLATEALALSEPLALRPSAAAFYWFQLGHFQFATGDVTTAASSLEQALEIDPDNPGAREQLAFVLASTGRTAEAIEHYEALLSATPAADVHGLYADLLRQHGDLDTAEEQESLGLALAAQTIDRFPAERRHLAGFYLTRDPAVALQLAEDDLAVRQDIGAYDTLAWALYHHEQFEAAYHAITEALRHGTKNASILYHAAAIAAANGDHTTARSLLTRALDLNPTFHPTETAQATTLYEELSTDRHVNVDQ